MGGKVIPGKATEGRKCVWFILGAMSRGWGAWVGKVIRGGRKAAEAR